MQLAENEIRAICLMAKEICMSQPNLLELEAPIKICGKKKSAFCLNSDIIMIICVEWHHAYAHALSPVIVQLGIKMFIFTDPFDHR